MGRGDRKNYCESCKSWVDSYILWKEVGLCDECIREKVMGRRWLPKYVRWLERRARKDKACHRHYPATCFYIHTVEILEGENLKCGD